MIKFSIVDQRLRITKIKSFTPLNSIIQHILHTQNILSQTCTPSHPFRKPIKRFVYQDRPGIES
jgi:hypothetical protein